MSDDFLMTDAEVVGRVLKGERHAFTQLIHRYQDRIYGLAYHHTRHFEDARDIAQDAFIRAYRQIQALREPAKFGPWLKQLTLNECRMRYRERAARKEQALTEAHDSILAEVGHSEEIDRKLALEQAMSALPEVNRLTLTLFYFHSYSLEELAAFLEVPTGTVMSRLRNARRQLKKEWQRMTQEVIENNRLPNDWAEKIPIPYDEYNQEHLPRQLDEPVSAFRKQLTLSAFPSGSVILAARFESGETGGVFDPVILTVRRPDGTQETVRLRMQSRKQGVEREGKLLPILMRLGYPVPELLAGPTADPDYPDAGLTSVTRILPGVDVLSQCGNLAPEGQRAWVDALFLIIEQMHDLTPAIEQEAIASELEQHSLAGELRGVIERGGPWMSDTEFVAAVRQLETVAATVETPLVFSNGVYAPNAFHTTDGKTVTGCNNFTAACFEDPHIGFAKYLIYDWYPLNRAGIIERWMTRRGLSKADFALRLGIRCLTTLQREIPVRGSESAEYRKAVLNYLRDALKEVAR